MTADMDPRDRLLLQIELLKAQRTICDLSIELYTRDLAALGVAVAPPVSVSAPLDAPPDAVEREGS